MNPGAWSVKNRVAANLLCAVLILVGIGAAVFFIPRAIFPEISTNFIVVTTVDPGNDLPEDIEKLVTRPVEEAVANVRGLRNLISNSQPGVSVVFMEIDASYTDLNPVLNDVRQEVAKIRRKLPSTVEEPVIQEVDFPLPLLTLGISYPADMPETVIRPALTRLQRDLRLVRGVAEVQIDGFDEREVWIEVNPDRIETLGLTVQAVTAAIDRANRDWSAGRIQTPGGERVVRATGQASNVRDFENLPILVQDGAVVLLRDVATITDRSAEDRTRARLNLRPGVTFNIVKQDGSDAREVADAALAVFRNSRALLPEGAEPEILLNSTLAIDIRIDTVLQNGFQALLIITLLLIVFLNWRLAILVAIGLPVSICGTFLVLLVMGKTFDVLSLFGMIMALGMLVDDAVVISENIYRHYERGMSPVEAAVRGTGEVVMPVIGSVATTVAAFLPLLLGEGTIGRFLFIVPVVVISALVFSLVQAFFILPSHMADFVRHPPSVPDLERRLAARPGWRERVVLQISIHYWDTRNAVDDALSWIIGIYRHLLTITLRHRYVVVAGFFGMAFASLGLIAAGVIPFRLFNIDFADRALVKLDLPANYSLDQTEEAVALVERAIAGKLPRDDVANIISQIGSRFNESNNFQLQGPNLAMITVDIDELNPGARRPSRIERDLQDVLAGFPQFTRATAEAVHGGPPVGLPVNVLILGDDFDVLRAISADIESRLAKLPGVENIANSFIEGRPEVRARINRELAALRGVSVRDAGLVLTGAYSGLESARMRWGDDEVRVRVIMDRSARGDPERLMGVHVLSERGEPVALGEIAEIGTVSSQARISRRDQARVITVSATVDSRVTTSAAVNRQIAEWTTEILREHPGYRIRLAGENEDTERSLRSMALASLLALFLIYTILAILFNSFSQPVIVMSVIPFGLVGVIGGLLFQGQPLGLMSIMGTIALAGIVVNNSVVFVDFINQFRNENPLEKEGDESFEHYRFDRWMSIYRAGSVRLRPIFLTSITTIAGLWSLAFLTSGQEEFLAPMAQAIVWGLSFATTITLVLVPCLFAILDDLHFQRLKRKRGSKP